MTLLAVAGGTGPLRFQWQFHGTNLPGATNATLGFPQVTRAADGLYRVRVENRVGGVFSAEVLLRVLVPPTISVLGNITMAEDTASGAVPFTVGDYETPSGALTVSKFSSNPELVPLSGILLGGAGSNRTVQILPSTNAFGSATITLVVRDESDLTATTSFTVTVQSVNDSPVLGSIAAVQTPEDTAATNFFTVGDVETAAGALTLGAISSDTNLLPLANIQFGGTGTSRLVTMLPATNQFGSVTVTVTVTDADNGSTSRSFVLTVAPVNDAPTLGAIANVSVTEDSGPHLVNLSGINTGAANEPQTLTITATSSDPAVLPHPVVIYTSPAVTGSLQFSPATNASGVATVTVTVDDGGVTNHTQVRTFTVTITPVNDAPIISALTNVTLLEDAPATAQTFVVGDVETSAGNLQLSAASSDTNLVPLANIALGGAGSTHTVMVTPAPDQHGSAIITVTVRDAAGATAESAFTLTVLPVNDPPVISAIASQVTDEDVAVPVPFTVHDVETPAAALVISAVVSNTNLLPAAGIVISGTGSNRVATFNPATNHFGTATVTVTCSDGTNMVSRDFTLTVTPVNDAPTLVALGNIVVNEDSGLHTLALAGIGTGAANELQILSISAVSSNPALVPDPHISYLNPQSTGTLSFVTLPDAAGTAVITVTIDDGAATNHSVSRTFTVTVLEVNDPPVLSHVPAQAMEEDTVKVISFTVSDDTTPAASLTVSAVCSDTNIVPNAGLTPGGSGASRSLTIQPATNRFGAVTITLTATDTNGAATSSAFALTVLPVNDPPTLSNLAEVLAAEDTNGVVVNFTVGDAETPAAALAVSVVSSNPVLLPPAGLVLGGAGGSRILTLTPASNQSGSAIITVTVHDSDGASASRSFTFTVTAIDDPPVISFLPALDTDEDAPLSFAFTVGDAETAAGSLSVTAASSNTNLVPAARLTLGGSGATRTLTMVPATNQFGTTVISISVSDGGASVTNSFTLTVNPVNDAPTLNAIGNLVLNEDAGLQTVNLAGIATGASNEFQVLTITAVSGDTNLVPHPVVSYNGSNATGTLNFTPVPNASGPALITVTVDDGAPSNRFASQAFLVTISATNDRPFISDIPNQVMNEDTLLAVAFTISDAETPAHRLTLTATSTNTTLLPVTNIFFDGAGPGRLLFLKPSLNATGLTLVTVTVSDGQTNATDSFLLTVSAVNDPPTLNPITNVALLVNFANTDISFNGISSGAPNENQTLSVTAVSSNTALVTINSVSYTAGATNGSVRLASPSNTGTGTAVVAVAVSDGITNVTRTFTVFVWPSGNAMPTVSAIASQVTMEDTPTPAIPFTVGDSVTPAALLTLSGLSSNTNVVPVSNIVFGGSGSNRTVTVTPAANVSGNASITIFVNDTNFGMANRTFALTVNPTNDLPQLSAIIGQTVTEDASLALPFTVSDVETPAGTLVLSVSSSNPGLLPTNNIVIGGSGTNRLLVLTPATNQSGSTLVTLTANDANGGSNSVSFTLTVTPVNDLPTLSPIADQNTAEDSATSPVAFTVGDVETAASALVLNASSSNPALVPVGNITFGGSGSNRTVSILPATNQSGTSAISIRVTDGEGGSVSNVFLVRVTPVNDPPTLDALTNATMHAGSVLVVALTGISPGPANESQPLSVTAVSSDPAVLPHPGVNYPGSGATGALTLAPPPGASGTATVTVTVNDGQPQNSLATRIFVVTVGALPAISFIADQTTDEDVSKVVAFTVGDTESSPANLSLQTASSNTNLLPDADIVLGGTGTNRMLTLTPALNQSGVSIVTVTVRDEAGSTASASFRLVVQPVNDPPTLDGISTVVLPADAAAQAVLLTGISSGATNENQFLEVSVSSSNPALIPAPQVDYLSPATTGMVNFAAAPNVSGTSILSAVVRDGEGASVTQSFTVTVLATNHPPVILDIPDQVATVSTPLVIGFQVGDVETPSGMLVVSVQSSNPSLVPSEGIVLGGSDGNRALLIAPAANTTGTVTIVVTVTDGGGATASDTFLLDIQPPGQPPSIVSQPSNQTVALGVPVSFTVTATGAAPLSYQWEHNGLALLDRTNAMMTLAAVQAVDAGSYRVRVSNARGSALSDAAALRVLVSPTITAVSNSGATAGISFTTVSGLNYVVEYRDAVDFGNWVMLASAPGTGGVVTIIDPGAAVASRFYRVRVE